MTAPDELTADELSVLDRANEGGYFAEPKRDWDEAENSDPDIWVPSPTEIAAGCSYVEHVEKLLDREVSVQEALVHLLDPEGNGEGDTAWNRFFRALIVAVEKELGR